jgi:hypothetical protein
MERWLANVCRTPENENDMEENRPPAPLEASMLTIKKRYGVGELW